VRGREALETHKARLQRPGRHESKQAATAVHTHTHTHTHARTPGPQDLHVELADDIQTGFPLPPRSTEPRPRHHQERHPKAELEGDPGTATPRPTQAS